MGKVAKWNS